MNLYINELTNKLIQINKLKKKIKMKERKKEKSCLFLYSF